MNFKKIIVFVLVIGTLLSLVGCGKTQDQAGTKQPEKKNIIVGTSPIFKDILLAVKDEFDKDGYTLEVKVFDDLVTPNIALQEGSIDANFYQHEPYLDQFNKNKGTNLVKYNGGIVKYFMGIYSSKIKNVNELKDGATIAVPNDPSNRGRALKALQANGLIKIKEGVDLPTKLDIVENNKNLNIVEMDVLKLVTSLADVDCATIISVVAANGKLDPKSAIATEAPSESDKYAIVIALNKDKHNEAIAARLEKALKSETLKKFLEEKYQGAVLPAF
ncbi:MetQ/NlpA family ABC transporter substrate-binding protein [Sporomusa sp. KB1]|jgi:D-methionine transport system substrate-binding protein|uniref:MetQ/NlpA family ABC transporter substrate-binding protein n=1 Tax=Sporomusa sp. KB1 TaxID=943346 RepID=UPI0011A23B42|nr:MetQ/NlpA family ABC transporter substrate-binding protein [Sporomusa sp. KB1]TWH46069.1 D-methionine transport system substrate-binding protein [Sporomusa sp. KB1]